MSNFELRIEQLENRSIQIVPNKNVAATLRSIAEGVGFKLEEKWDSFQIGAKLIDFINENSDENAKLKDAVKKAAVVNVSLAGAESSVAKPAKQATGSNIIDLNNDPDVQAYLNASPAAKYFILREFLPSFEFLDIAYDPKKGVYHPDFDVNDVIANNFSFLLKIKASKYSRSKINLIDYISDRENKELIFNIYDLNEDDFYALDRFFVFIYDFWKYEYTQEELDEAVKGLLSFSTAKWLSEISIYNEKNASFNLPKNITGFDNVETISLVGISEFPIGLSKLKNLKELTILPPDEETESREFKVNGSISGFMHLEHLVIREDTLSLNDALKFVNLPRLVTVNLSKNAFPDEKTQQKLENAFGLNLSFSS